MGSFNRVILMGNITRDPELRYIPSGTAVTDLGLAVNDRRKNASGEWVDETTFVDVTLWGRTAEIACEYLNKGSPVFIEGRLKLDSWEKDGKKNYKLRVVGERLQLIGAKGGGGGGNRGGGGGGFQSAPAHDESEAGFGGGDYYEDAPAGAPAANRSAGTPPKDDIPF
ncbi:MAG TPA: single-stranded DNA-binding protein [Pirellulales bacterium]|nr:single-stranded DNA-binding protein [Pirellulales bacterium]